MPEVDIATRRNLELKVRVSREALADVRDRLAGLATECTEVQHQVDRYFRVPDGRLKLRTIASDSGEARAELIAYRRPDLQRSRWSFYRISPVAMDQAGNLAETLEQVLPVLVVVRKRRELCLLGATRVHLDEVDGLGAFIELETVVTDQSPERAAAEHRDVTGTLGLEAWPVEAGSYSDLLRATRFAEAEARGESDE